MRGLRLLRRACLAASCALACGNEFTLTDRYTADPAPFVHDGRLWIYSSHDLAAQRGWHMTDYSLMSTTDLVNWRDDGIPFSIANQSWGTYAWAQQVIASADGSRFFMYWPGMVARGGGGGGGGSNATGTGVAVSSAVTGPFLDPVGAPLLPCGDDPTVFRDDDGRAYLCGNCGGPLCAELAPNMPALASAPAHLVPPLPQWFEAPWLSKWNGVYYLSYMCGGDPGHGQGAFNHYGWDLCIGSCAGAHCSPLGPYVFRGSLMWSPPGNCGNEDAAAADCALVNNTSGDNNHQGIVEFPPGSGRLYLAYHTRTLAKSRGAYLGFQRNVAIDRLYARGDAGVFPLPAGLPWVVNDTAPGAGAGLMPVTATPAWVRQLAYVDPYARVSALLSAAMSRGLGSEPCAEGGLNLGFISDGATLALAGVDFGAAPGAATVTFRVATPLSGAAIEVLLDGAAAAACAIPRTGDWQIYANVSCALRAGAAVGVVANLTLRFSGPGSGGLMNLIYYAFAGGSPSGALPPPVAVPLAWRSAASGRYVCAAADAGALVTASAAAPCPWTLLDMEDGTYALATATAAGTRYACVGAAAALAASADAHDDPCTRFFLYGTPPGSYGLLAAQSGRFLTDDGAAAPIVATTADPRERPDDGARWWLQDGSSWHGRGGGGGSSGARA